MIILAIDALEYEYVTEFNCKNLMQEHFGKTDLSDFSDARTMVIWSSFLAGKNKEKEILSLGPENMWKFQIKTENTFLSNFKNTHVIDLPGYTYKQEEHKKEKDLLRGYFERKNKIEDLDKIAFENYRKNKEEFLIELEKDYDILCVYFSIADIVGHLSFGDKVKMKMIYKELDDLAKFIREKNHKLMVISDHGMKAIGRFGDHSNYGFWSTNFDLGLTNPKATDFHNVFKSIKV